ncbi:hypothetical protein [Arthrobacter sp. NPDC058127]|uniref:hypothetical protein n=1 Tax=Arthrobacter sp. NPDC058127 TaxID=3346351 RepID=UPI0036ECFA26
MAARTYAFEGRCFVVSAAQYLHTEDVPEELLSAYRAGSARTPPKKVFCSREARASSVPMDLGLPHH